HCRQVLVHPGLTDCWGFLGSSPCNINILASECQHCDSVINNFLLLLPLSLFAGCKTEWDEIGCWLRAEVGQVVNLSCSEVFQHFSSNQGYVYRNCTADGWSEMYPPYEEACVFSDDSEPESETSYLYTFRQVYTVGYATSLISLITAIVVKFRCTRNYIHINLFASFILRASAVFIKDTVLFADETLDHCSMSTVRGSN
uniref:G-protein coupled receptors family 2 profile 1 domain-containing protein n=1 Tax=Oreochromis aureus TaxID=47969 RepID=A0AAZ1XZA9_OREAU